MDPKLALRLGVPFVGVAWTLVAVVALVPGFLHGRLLMALLLVLALGGLIALLVGTFERRRANSALRDTLYPIAGLLVALGVAFHQQVGAIARDIVDVIMPNGATSDGMRVERADDLRFHVSLTVDGNAVDFMVDPETPFNVLMPDMPRQIGIASSSLVYDERITVTAGGDEYAADVVLPKARLGAAVIENLPFKVFATNRSRNVLGKAFLERFESWRVDGDTLILVH
jgi:clan AA aspartic protease (TIGR02281 family)